MKPAKGGSKQAIMACLAEPALNVGYCALLFETSGLYGSWPMWSASAMPDQEREADSHMDQRLIRAEHSLSSLELSCYKLPAPSCLDRH
jgi:hypothetical protein